MLTFIRVALAMVPLHSYRAVTKTEVHIGWETEVLGSDITLGLPEKLLFLI